MDKKIKMEKLINFPTPKPKKKKKKKHYLLSSRNSPQGT